jgi:hypothetical protein
MNPLVKNFESSPQAHRRHDFDELYPLRTHHLSLAPAEIADVPLALSIAEKSIAAELADARCIGKIIARNSDNITLIRKQSEIVGVCALLMLRAAGLEALLLEEINLKDPDDELLTTEAETPAAIYVWGIVSPGTASEALRIMSVRLRRDNFARANLFSRPVTAGGERLMASLGFTPVPHSSTGLFRYLRKANRRRHSARAA